MTRNILDWMVWREERAGIVPETALNEALAYFEQKYGQKPNRLQVPPGFPPVSIAGLHVEIKRFVDADCLHLAYDEDYEKEVENVQT